MHLRTASAWTALGLLLGPGCASPSLPHTAIVLEPIGPRGAGPRPAPTGYLRVHTATRDVLSGQLPYQVPTPYWIFDEGGRPVRSVVNHVGDTDQAPMLVMLPPGRYRVLAEAADYGRVTAPVVITAGMLTEVHLQRGGMPEGAAAPHRELVRLPEGPVAGFRAREPQKPTGVSRP